MEQLDSSNMMKIEMHQYKQKWKGLTYKLPISYEIERKKEKESKDIRKDRKVEERTLKRFYLHFLRRSDSRNHSAYIAIVVYYFKNQFKAEIKKLIVIKKTNLLY